MNTGRTHFKVGQPPAPHHDGCTCMRCTTGEDHKNWKGDSAHYRSKHGWMVRHYGQPKRCEECGLTDGAPRYFHWANISGQYRRERSDWKRLCAKCHRQMDLGQLSRGDNHYASKLKSPQVMEIKRRLPFETQKSLAVEYGVNPYTIWAIASGKTWKHLTTEVQRGE